MVRPNRIGQDSPLAGIAALTLVTLLLVASPLPVAADCPGTPLLNPGFEDGYSERGAGEVSVANGWHPFWQQGPYQEDGYNLRPEYKPEDASRFGRRRVLNGNFSQKWFNTYGTHNAGIYQQVNVPQGSVVTFSAWGQAWSSNESNPDEAKGGWYAIYVGIDPTGGTDWTSSNIIWSEPSRALNEWAQVTVQVQAQASTVTAYIRGYAEFRNKHNDAYVDEACLTYVAPTPRPTNTPRPTDTPTITPTPSNTPTPTDTSTPEPSPTPEATATPGPGALQVLAYEDTNGSGARDAGEPLVARAGIEIRDAAGAPVAAYVAGETGDPVTTEDLPAGEYRVESVPPVGYVASSPSEVTVTVGPGETVEVAFGLRYEPTETPEPTVPPSATPEPASTDTPRPAPTPTPAAASGLGRYAGVLVAAVAVGLVVLMRALRARG